MEVSIMRFNSRCGVVMWVTSLLLLAVTVFFITQYSMFDSLVGYLALVLIMAVSTILTFTFVLRNYIIVTENQVKVCFGITTSVIDIPAIFSLKKVTSAVASSSASLRRIEIKFNKNNSKREIYVSPKDEDNFIQTVCSYNQNVKVF